MKIDRLKEAGVFDDIVVNTDSEEAIQIAKAKGVSYHRREPYYASSECSGSDFFKHLGEVTQTDAFVYTPCTSPFIATQTIKKCIETYKESPENDCVATVTLVKEFMWLDGKPINYQKECAPNSQNLPDITAINFGLTIVDRQSLIRNKNIIGDNPLFVVTSGIECVDIDTPLDFYVAEKIYERSIIEGKDLLE